MVGLVPVVSLRLKGLLVGVAIAAVAVGTVAVVVLPGLEDRLVGDRLRELARAVPGLRAAVMAAPTTYHLQVVSEFAGAQADARVVVFGVLAGDTLLVLADSARATAGSALDAGPIVRRARASGRPSQGRVDRAGGADRAEIALPVAGGLTILISASLAERLAALGTIRRRLVIASLVALAAALVIGAGTGFALTRRLAPLDAGAKRIAAGDLTSPLLVTGRDELAGLARSFESMRLALVQLARARREFISNASHELRTPVFALGGFLELLRSGELRSGDHDDAYATMTTEVDRLARLSTTLIDLARLEAGDLPMQTSQLDLSALVRALLVKYRPRLDEAGLTAHLEHTNEVVALADERLTVRIISELLDNCLAHTPADTAITITCQQEHATVRVTVADTGPGIPADEADHIFEPFIRVGGRQASGAGLGLTLARRLAGAQHATLDLRPPSDETGGAVFQLTLRHDG